MMVNLQMLSKKTTRRDFETYVKEFMKKHPDFKNIHYLDVSHMLSFVYRGKDVLIVCHNITNALNFLFSFQLGAESNSYEYSDNTIREILEQVEVQ